MVHLHPGGNFFGAPYTLADAFTARNVIVVTLAYRLGVFGFMGHAALTAEGGGGSGEYGAYDQLRALHWVHDNIGAFGGDPDRVTLFGSSAGSFDTVSIIASPLSRGLIARAAVQGAAFWPLTGTNVRIADAERFGADVAGAVGCGSASDVPACLRALPADTLVLAAGPGDTGVPVGGPVLPRPPLDAVNAEGSVPLLIGFDREEDSVFAPFPFPDPYRQADWVKDTNAIVGPSYGSRARSLYPPSSYDSLFWSMITLRTDAVRGCPTRRLANAAAQRGAPVWRWLYTHTYEDPFFAQFRASHVLEEPLLWGADVLGFGVDFSPAEQELSHRMTDYWTNFAKAADPNGAGLPFWPRYDTPAEKTLTLDEPIRVITSYHDQQCAFLEPVQPFPAPWARGKGPTQDPPGFVNGHARAIP